MWVFLLILLVLLLTLLALGSLIKKKSNSNSNNGGGSTGTNPIPPPQIVTQGLVYQSTFGSSVASANDVANNKNWELIKSRKPYDLTVCNEIRASTLRIYGWNYTLKHNLFIQDITSANITCQFSMPNSMLVHAAEEFNNFWQAMLHEITSGNIYRSCVHSLAIGNELSSTNCDWISRTKLAIQSLLNTEKKLGIIGLLPPIVIPCSDSDPIKTMQQLLKAMPSFGSRIVFGLNTTESASVTLKTAAEFTKVYPNNTMMVTEWSYGVTPQPKARGNYMEVETKALLNGIKTNKYSVTAIFGYLYFQNVDGSGFDAKYGFTCFTGYHSEDCLANGTCPPANAKLGLWRRTEDNPLTGLALAYGGALSSKISEQFGDCK